MRATRRPAARRPAHPVERFSQAAASRHPRRRLRVLLWRWRHLVASLAMGLAVALVVGEMSPDPAPTQPAVVLAATRQAGDVLRARDLVVRPVPAGLVPEGAMVDPALAVGASLAVGLPSGFPIVDGVLVGPGLAAGAPRGTVVVPLRLADRDVSGLLRAGDRVDILQAPPEGGPARVIARRVLVMARNESPVAGALDLGSASPPLLLVAARPEVATLLVGAGAWDPITAVLVAEG